MGYTRRSITLPVELLLFAERKLERERKRTGEPANISKYVRGLIREDKERERENNIEKRPA